MASCFDLNCSVEVCKRVKGCNRHGIAMRVQGDLSEFLLLCAAHLQQLSPRKPRNLLNHLYFHSYTILLQHKSNRTTMHLLVTFFSSDQDGQPLRQLELLLFALNSSCGFGVASHYSRGVMISRTIRAVAVALCYCTLEPLARSL